MLCFYFFPEAVDFFLRIGYHMRSERKRNVRRLRAQLTSAETLPHKRRCSFLKNSGKLSVFIAILSVAAAMMAAAVAVVLFFEKKKKDEEDLEHYLDCSIQ